MSTCASKRGERPAPRGEEGTRSYSGAEQCPLPALGTEVGAVVGAAEVKAGAVDTMSSVSVTEALSSHAHVGEGNETLGHIKEGARMRHPPPRLAAGILGGL